jgi:hypothetical protein
VTPLRIGVAKRKKLVENPVLMTNVALPHRNTLGV